MSSSVLERDKTFVINMLAQKNHKIRSQADFKLAFEIFSKYTETYPLYVYSDCNRIFYDFKQAIGKDCINLRYDQGVADFVNSGCPHIVVLATGARSDKQKYRYELMITRIREGARVKYHTWFIGDWQ